jgi:UDP-3-O-[3-hydroxymyristoyl] glucosamine N-acyltransferase
MVMAGAQSGVINSIEAGQMVLGAPSMPIRTARRVYNIFRDLPDLLSRVKQLEKEIEKLTAGTTKTVEGD